MVTLQILCDTAFGYCYSLQIAYTCEDFSSYLQEIPLFFKTFQHESARYGKE